MKTKLTMANGDVHIVDGSPHNFAKNATGRNPKFEVSPGKFIKIADIVMFQQA